MTNTAMETNIHPQQLQDDADKSSQQSSQTADQTDQIVLKNPTHQNRTDAINPASYPSSDAMKNIYGNSQPTDNMSMMTGYPPVPSYNDGMVQRSMYMDQKANAAPSSNSQPRYIPSVTATSSSTPTPTLNQLLTQTPQNPPQTQKYPGSGAYGDVNNASSGSGMAMMTNTPTMYDNWVNQNPNQQGLYQGGHMNVMRPGMQPSSRQMAPNQVQMSMYDRSGQPMPYRPSSNPYGPPPGAAPTSTPYRRMPGPQVQGYPSQQMQHTNREGGQMTPDSGDMMAAPNQQRNRPMMSAGGMMGPPRLPTPHQMDPSASHMMPPPNQGQGYQNMPYGGGPTPAGYRNAQQMSPYGNFPNQAVSQGSRPSYSSGGGGPAMSQQQAIPTPQINGPMSQLKTMPHSPSQSSLSQSSPGQVRGLSPAPPPSNQQPHSLTPSPALSTNQRIASPCPSPSVSVTSHHSRPASPASTSSPHPGTTESQSSPRADIKSAAKASSTQNAQNSPQIASSPGPKQQISKPSTPLQANPNTASPLPQQPRSAASQVSLALQQAPMQPSMSQQQHYHQPADTQMSTASLSQTQPGVVPSNQPNQVPPSTNLPTVVTTASINMNQMVRPTGTSQMSSNYPRQPGPGMGPTSHPPHGQPDQNSMANGTPYQPYPMSNQTQGHMPFQPRPQYPGGQPYPAPTGGQPPYNNSSQPQNQWNTDQMNGGGAGCNTPNPAANTAMFGTKQDKTAVPSPMSAAASPAVGSPAASESNRRPPSRKSSVAPSPGGGGGDSSRGSTPKPLGPPPPGTLHGSSMDVVNKQLEFGTEPMRRPFMEHLCMFYYEKSQPLTAMPMIGKNALDIWKIYMAVKDRGGFQQVCKRKQWKQVGAVLATTTSQNAAFSLKKAYIKYLLPYECKFERGGVDPQAILAAVDTKKDKKAAAASTPSPANSNNNSNDAAGGQMRNFPPDYGAGMNPAAPHPNHPPHMGAPAPPRPGYPHPDPNMPPHQYMGYSNVPGPPPGSMPNGHQHPPPPGMNALPPQQGMLGQDESMPVDPTNPYQQQPGQQSAPHPHSQQQPQQHMSVTAPGPQYNQQSHSQQHMGPGGYPVRHPYYNQRMPPPNHQRPPFQPQGSQQLPLPQPPNSGAPMRMMGPGGPAMSQSGYPNMYRDSPSHPSSQVGPITASSHPTSSYPTDDSQMARPQVQQPPTYSQSSDSSHASRTPSMANSTPSTSSHMRYQQRPTAPGFQTPSRGALSAMLTNASVTPGVVDSHSFTETLSGWTGGLSFVDSLNMPPPPPPATDSTASRASAVQPDSRTPTGPQWRHRPSMAPPGYGGPPTGDLSAKRSLAQSSSFGFPRPVPVHPKKEVTFPPGSVEAACPAKNKRRQMTVKDLGRACGVISSHGRIDSRKLIMCLRSGLLTESTWALDTITILLLDDSMALQLTLEKNPGLLDILISHYKQVLSAMFDELSDLFSINSSCRIDSSRVPTAETEHEEDSTVLYSTQQILNSTNYSWTARNGMKVVIDTDLKQGKTIPSPSMYSTKPYKVDDHEPVVVSAFESEGTVEFYKSFFKCHSKSHSDLRRDSNDLRRDSDSLDLLKDDETSVAANSPAPTSHTSGGTDCSAQTEKRLAPDSGLSHFPVCACDMKSEPCEHSNDGFSLPLNNCKKVLNPSSIVSNATGSLTDSMDGIVAPPVSVKEEGKVETRAENSSISDLHALEAKLQSSRKRRFSDTIDDEPIIRDGEPLEADVDLKTEELSTRCATLANIFRSLSFLAVNEKTLAKNDDLLEIFGRLLNLRLKVDTRKEKRCWWWEMLELLRENTLVTISNIAGHLNFINTSNKIAYPFFDGLLYWSTTSAAYACDPLPHTNSYLTIQSLALEVVCKLCAHTDNINMLLATPPWSRISRLFQVLSRLLTKRSSDYNQVMKEFSIVIISCLAQADPLAAHGLAIQPACVSQLIGVLESAEAAAFSIAQQKGVEALRENPEAMGTSLDMIRRTSGTLLEMSQVKENHPILLKQQDRLLSLVMSQILDQHVAKMLSDVLYECIKSTNVVFPPSYVETPEEKGVEDMEAEPVCDSENDSSNQSSECCRKDSLSITESQEELNKENINNSSPSPAATAAISTNSAMSTTPAASSSMELVSAVS